MKSFNLEQENEQLINEVEAYGIEMNMIEDSEAPDYVVSYGGFVAELTYNSLCHNITTCAA